MKVKQENVVCSICGNAPSICKNMCRKCYTVQYNKTPHLTKHEKHFMGLISKTCIVCGSKHIFTKNMCMQCYGKMYRKKTRNAISYTKNRACPSFLGCHVAEQVLQKVFKDVETMPLNHPGYDFICNRGKKIDVKSSCTRNGSHQTNSWEFCVTKNTIADYFLCIAFDNRESLTPLHLWLLPGKLVNMKTSITISKSTINKWNEYKLDITKTVNCCNIIKT